MKREQKLRPDRSQVVISQYALNFVLQPLYGMLLEDFKNDPYISIYVKGKLWQFTDTIDPH